MRNIVFLGLIFFLGACSKQSLHGEKNHLQKIMMPCPSFAESGKPALVYGAECGVLNLKQNPADANSPEIPVHILRLPAISPAPKQDPLFLIQGGPGGSSIEMADLVHRAFEDVRKNRDLIFVDQRGTGKSNPLNCEHLTDLDLRLSEADAAEKNIRLLKACAEKYKQQAPFYTTPYAVQDLDQVRRALGYSTINIWGVSYGTRVALEYAREYPERVRSIVLDGVAPVQIALPKYFQRDALAALNAVNDACAAQEKCKLSFGDMVLKATRVSEQLKHLQESGQTLSVEFEHPRYQKKTTQVLTAKEFSQLIFMALYSRDLTVLLPHAIAAADQGDYRLVAALSTLASEQMGFTGISDAMRYSVVCNEDAHFISAKDMAESRAFFGFNMLKEVSDVCAFWPKAELPEHYFDPVKSVVPALILSGAQDPVTPLQWAELVKNNLPNALSLVSPGGNHSVSMDGCMPKIIAQFIALGSAQGIDTNCVKQIIPLSSVLGANESPDSSSSAGTLSSSSSSQSSMEVN